LVIAQSEFRREFGIHRNRAVPSAHAIKAWIWNFEAAGSTLKTKGGSVKTSRSQGNSCGDASKGNGWRSQETCRVPRAECWSSELCYFQEVELLFSMC
jgi:hypothetical protein